MIKIGTHVNFVEHSQLLGSVNESLSYGANTFMIYTGSKATTEKFPFNKTLNDSGLELMRQNNIDINDVVVHAPFIINLANNKEAKKYNFYIHFLRQEIDLCNELGIKLLVLHPGSATDLPKDVALKNIADGLNKVLNDKNNITVLLEYMSGKGSEVGSSIDELKEIIENIERKDLIGVCLDTCHMNDSGVDLSKFDEFLSEFDKSIGIEKIKCIHINDSHNILGTHKDRHANIGYGEIGFETILSVIYNNKLLSVPKILETPFTLDTASNEASYKLEIDSILNKEFNDFII